MPSLAYFDVVERRHVEPALRDEAPQHVVAIARVLKRLHERRDERLAFSRCDDVGKQRQRLGVHERDGAADHHDRVVRRAVGGAQRNPRQAQQCQHVGVVPLERDRQREDVELANQRLRLERHEPASRVPQRLDLALGRQERALADDAILGVEERIDRLEAEIGHPDEIGIGKGERHPQPAAMGLPHVTDLLRQEIAGLLALRPPRSARLVCAARWRGLPHGLSGH